MDGGEGTLDRCQLSQCPQWCRLGVIAATQEGARGAECTVALRRQRGGDGGGGRAGWRGAVSRRRGARRARRSFLPVRATIKEAVAEGGSPARAGALRGGGRRALCSVPGLEVWPAVWPVPCSPGCVTLRAAAPGQRAPAVRGLCPYHWLWRNGVQRRSHSPLRPKWGGPSRCSDRLL